MTLPDDGGAPARAAGEDRLPEAIGGFGAMNDTRRIVAGVIAGADQAAGRARGLADRLGDDRDRMLIALGGGPPPELREAGARNRDAVRALDEAAAALLEAATALRSFSHRTR